MKLNEREFNLIDEPWIRVMDENCKVVEVSLLDAIINAHKYKCLGGELPTLYRYATVNATELCDTLGKENVAETVKKFGQAFIRSMPTGKINTFANRTFPDTVYITLRSD